MSTEGKEKKIAVVGLGGVGGYLAGMLGSACPHVTFVARNERLEAIRKNGLVLHSEYSGERIVRPEKAVPLEELETQDYIFLCVKNYSLEKACADLAHAVCDDTVLVPVMNGVDPADRVRRFLGKGTVVDALIYIVSFANSDFSVTQQGDYANLKIGTRNGDAKEQQAVREVSGILSAAGIDHAVAEDIELEIWKKYILNCAFNVTTAFYDHSIGAVRSDEKKAAEYEALVKEACQVAVAKGVPIKPEHRDSIIDRFYHAYADEASSSLQRDVHEHRQSELETFSGYLVREAQKLGIPVPVSRRMYEGLKNKTSN